MQTWSCHYVAHIHPASESDDAAITAAFEAFPYGDAAFGSLAFADGPNGSREVKAMTGGETETYGEIHAALKARLIEQLGGGVELHSRFVGRGADHFEGVAP